MAIPDYQTLMKPLLEVISDGNPHPMSEVVEALAKRFGLTPEELAETISRGTQPLFYNRVGWARTFLKKAGLLVSPKRGFVQIKDRGRQVLQENVEKIDNDYLMRFEEFRNFIEASKAILKAKAGDDGAAVSSEKTPQEALEVAYFELRSALISEIQESIKELPPSAFERLVVDVLVKMGYGGRDGQSQVVGRSGDEGIDGVIRQDPLGIDTIYIQAKQWAGPVGRPELQKFVGALQAKSAKKGVFITSSDFTNEAKDYAARTGLILIDGKRLSELMFEYGLGVSPVKSYEVKRIDSDYFAELKGAA